MHERQADCELLRTLHAFAPLYHTSYPYSCTARRPMCTFPLRQVVELRYLQGHGNASNEHVPSNAPRIFAALARASRLAAFHARPAAREQAARYDRVARHCPHGSMRRCIWRATRCSACAATPLGTCSISRLNVGLVGPAIARVRSGRACILRIW